MTKDPFAVPEDAPNPFSMRPGGSADAALNPYAPTSHVSETDERESDVDAFRRRYLSHEASIKSIGMLYVIPGVLMFVYCVVITGMVAYILLVDGGNQRPGVVGTDAAIVMSICGSVGVLFVYTGLGLRRLTVAARRLATLFSVFGLVMFPIGTLINGYILYLLQSRKGKVVFSEEYRDVIRRTPHIKYRTSFMVKVLVVILIAVIGLGVVATIFGVQFLRD